MINQDAEGARDRLDRRHGPRPGARARPRTKDIKVIAYDRLINEHARTSTTTPPSTTTRSASCRASSSRTRSASTTARARSTSSPSPARPDDNNAKFFFSGAWDVLLPYVESGKLVVPVGQGAEVQRRLGQHRHPGLGVRHGAVRDGEPAQLVLHRRQEGRRRPVPERLPRAGHRAGARRRRLQAGRGLAGAHRSGRRPGQRQEHPRRQAVDDGLEGHPHPRRPGRQDGRPDRQGRRRSR